MAVETFLGTRAQRAFMLTIAIQAVVVLAMIGITYGLIGFTVDTTEGTYRTVPCYQALFALAEIFELVMAWDALRMRNTIQLIALLVFHLALVAFASLQAYETWYSIKDSCGKLGTCPHLWARVEPYLIVAPCVIFSSWFAMVAAARYLYFEFGWAIFHVVGASPKAKVMYQYYQVMICFLKFDFFCFIGVTMQLLIVVLQRNTAEFAITVIALPVVLILLILAGVAVQREIKWMMSVALGLMLAAETYFIYKLVRFFEPSTEGEYFSTRTTLTFFTIVAFLILFATFAVGLRCFADFDKGLIAAKTASLHPQRPSGFSKPNTPSMNMSGVDRQSYFSGGQPLAPRMSIE